LTFYWGWTIARAICGNIYYHSELMLADVILGTVFYAGMALYVCFIPMIPLEISFTYIFAAQS